MKKYLIILIIAILLGGIAWYLFGQSDKSTSSYTKNMSQNSSQQNSATLATNSPQSSGNKPADETGWSASAPDKPIQTPAPDVSSTFNIGNGSSDPKNVSATKGQRVALTFTNSNINDQVLIEGYDVNTYIIPLSESTIEFTVDKSGTFNITLAKKKTIIGTLKIN